MAGEGGTHPVQRHPSSSHWAASAWVPNRPCSTPGCHLKKGPMGVSDVPGELICFPRMPKTLKKKKKKRNWKSL